MRGMQNIFSDMCLMIFLDVDAERDEPQNEDEESSVNKTATIKKNNRFNGF